MANYSKNMRLIFGAIISLSLAACAAPDSNSEDYGLTYGQTQKVVAPPTAPTTQVSEITRRGLSIAPTSTFWNSYKEYEELGAVNLFVRRIERGESLGDAARRAYGQSEFGGSVAFYGKGVDIPLHNHSRGACYFIADLQGKPAKIRNAQGLDAYLFTHPIRESEDSWKNLSNSLGTLNGQLAQLEKQRSDHKSNIRIADYQIRTSTANLKNDPTFQNNQCVLPKHDPIPKGPALPDQKRVQQQAHGYCMDIFANGVSDGEKHVTNAVRRLGKRRWIDEYDDYLNGSQDICVEVPVSQWNDVACEVSWSLGNIFFNLGEQGKRACLNQVLESCAASAIYNCNKDYLQWKKVRDAIVSEPYKIQQACRAEIQNINENRRKIPTNEQQIVGITARIEQKKQEIAAFSPQVRAAAQAIPKSLPLDQVMCRL